MNPLAIIAPLALVIGGLLMFFFLPLDWWVRSVILGGELLAAAFLAFILWRRGR